MAGRPKLQALGKKIESLGGEGWILDRIADGEKIATIAKELEVSRQLVYRWADATPERKDLVQAALRASAHSLAEDAGTVLDDLANSHELSSADVALASHRAQYRKWLAGIRNKEDYGDKAAATVQISVGSLHLDALRIAGADPRIKAAENEARLISAGEVDPD